MQQADPEAEEEADEALQYVEFLFRRRVAQPCRRKCVQCKRKAKLAAHMLRDEDLGLL